MRILLVEDDPQLGDTVRRALAAEGYAVDWLADGAGLEAALACEAVDLLVLDVRLPGRSGIDLLRALRSAGRELPVLLLTACDATEDKVRGLDAGADDYLTKPFEMDEFLARVRSLLRRTGSRAPLLAAGPLALDPAARRVSYRGEPVEDLTAKELAILELLLRNRGRFVTKRRLLEGTSNWDDEAGPNTIEVYVSRLRKRFGRELIETLRGVGYRIP